MKDEEISKTKLRPNISSAWLDNLKTRLKIGECSSPRSSTFKIGCVK